MLTRLLRQTFQRRKGRIALTVLAVMLGTAVATALLGISADIMTKMSRELRSYGANILVTPSSEKLTIDVAGIQYTSLTQDSYLDQRDLPKLKTIFWRNNILGFAPYLSAPVQAGEESQELMLTGTWFDQEVALPPGSVIRTGFTQQTPSNQGMVFQTGVRTVSPWWQVEGEWVADRDTGSALVGASAARKLKVKPGDTLTVKHDEHLLPLRVAGILTTGGFEEDQVIVSLPVAQQLLQKPYAVSRLWVSALTLPKQKLSPDIRDKKIAEMTSKEYEKWYCSPIIEAITTQIEEVIPQSEAWPVRQISEGEGSFLLKIQWLLYLATFFALTAGALGVLTTMNTIVLERRGEIGLMKALGADNTQVAFIFLVEASIIGLWGGTLGFFGGTFLAGFIGEKVFAAPISINLSFLPIALLSALAIALIGSLFPVRQAMKIDPVILLRGN